MMTDIYCYIYMIVILRGYNTDVSGKNLATPAMDEQNFKHIT